MADNNANVNIKFSVDTKSVDEQVAKIRENFQKIDDFDFDNMQTLEQMLGEANDGAQKMLILFGQNSKEFKTASQNVTELKGAMASYEGSVLSTTQKMANMAQIGISGMAGIQGAMQALGVESETAEQAIAKLQGIMALSQSIKDVKELGSSFNLLGNSVSKSTGSINGANTATKVLGVSFKALGIGLLVAALGYLVTNWDKVTASLTKAFPWLNKIGDTVQGIIDIFSDFGKILSVTIPRAFEIMKAAASFNFSEVSRLSKKMKDEVIQAGNEIISAANSDRALEKLIEDEDKKIEILAASGKDVYELEKRQNKRRQQLQRDNVKEIDKLKQEQAVADAAHQKKITDEANKNLKIREDKAKEYYNKLSELAKTAYAQEIAAHQKRTRELILLDLSEYRNKIEAIQFAADEERKQNELAIKAVEDLNKANKNGSKQALQQIRELQAQKEIIDGLEQKRIEKLGNETAKIFNNAITEMRNFGTFTDNFVVKLEDLNEPLSNIFGTPEGLGLGKELVSALNDEILKQIEIGNKDVQAAVKEYNDILKTFGEEAEKGRENFLEDWFNETFGDKKPDALVRENLTDALNIGMDEFIQALKDTKDAAKGEFWTEEELSSIFGSFGENGETIIGGAIAEVKSYEEKITEAINNVTTHFAKKLSGILNEGAIKKAKETISLALAELETTLFNAETKLDAALNGPGAFGFGVGYNGKVKALKDEYAALTDLRHKQMKAELAEVEGNEQAKQAIRNKYQAIELRDKQNFDMEKRELLRQEVLAYADATASIGDMLQTFADQSAEGTRKQKTLSIAAATIQMLSGVVTAIAQAQQLGPIAGPIMAVANSASVVASGVANIRKISQVKVPGGDSVSVPAQAMAPRISNPLNTRAIQDVRITNPNETPDLAITDKQLDNQAKRQEYQNNMNGF